MQHPRVLPPRSTAGQLTLDQHIGVRIPGGQPITFRYLPLFVTLPKSSFLDGDGSYPSKASGRGHKRGHSLIGEIDLSHGLRRSGFWTVSSTIFVSWVLPPTSSDTGNSIHDHELGKKRRCTFRFMIVNEMSVRPSYLWRRLLTFCCTQQVRHVASNHCVR